MLVNADFSRTAIVAPDQYRWIASPQSGVERVMLDRRGGENARATSIVRYAPESRFPCHRHPGGEEILVLSGTFSDADADYPAGWYLRNPPGSSRCPFSNVGATIFVKLRQMVSTEHEEARIDTRDPARWAHFGGRDICRLYSDGTEEVCMHRVAPGEIIMTETGFGAEMLVLVGDVGAEGRTYPRGSWIRLPAGGRSAITSGSRGATVYLKTGHLTGVTSGA
ncbi:anti-sigma factor [Burkholderia sp. Bp9017]|uniref:cupin domain-containing protein n=1 Tax=unclassified Burkholderia TaxID=2613784 RepID=UPI000F5E3EA0|nr:MULTISPECIES: cupin domain-containing protein [unclassified Burkholderia]RQZ14174.1 anti-sigma factor [Burkholderia sp. Bp9017]RQZ31246.1 anti-sigma factor [Burkholderia sp. Bp9016]